MIGVASVLRYPSVHGEISMLMVERLCDVVQAIAICDGPFG